MSSDTGNSEQIKELVRERYGSRARGVIELAETQVDECGDSACCSPSDAERAMRLYQDAQLAGLPAESVAASAGCGNPTALAGLQPGERVLDLGSGGGIDCFLAAGQVGEQGRVYGLDMTDDMLALARANQSRVGLDNVEFIKGEIEDIPLPDGSVNVVISNCVICLSPDKDAVFRESFRVLTPGGRLHISDMMSEDNRGPARTDAEAWTSCIAGAEDRETYLDRLARAGFTGIEITEEQERLDEEGIPTNVVSIKVVARKPG